MSINILDTTLRDGSYSVNFSFTMQKTSAICKKLEEAGIQYIEVGHGLGLNGSQSYGSAVQTDKEYLLAACMALKKAKFGVFCIPGIARLGDIDMAAKFHTSFIRVGINPHETEKAAPFIERAKYHGMTVTANLMQSSLFTPKDYAQEVCALQQYGADVVYLVDSCGSMFPEDIREYYSSVRCCSSIPLGFHGHNNLGLAVANSLEAINLGFSFIDSSLRGLGRSLGNPATEMIVAALQKKGMAANIDLLRILNVGYSEVASDTESGHNYNLDVICGFLSLHSNCVPYAQQYSEKYNVNLFKLLFELSSSKAYIDEDYVEEVAESLSQVAV